MPSSDGCSSSSATDLFKMIADGPHVRSRGPLSPQQHNFHRYHHLQSSFPFDLSFLYIDEASTVQIHDAYDRRRPAHRRGQRLHETNCHPDPRHPLQSLRHWYGLLPMSSTLSIPARVCHRSRDRGRDMHPTLPRQLRDSLW